MALPFVGTLRSWLAPVRESVDAQDERAIREETRKLERRLSSAQRKLAESMFDLDNTIDPYERYRDGDDWYGPAGANVGTTNARATGGDWILLRNPQDLRNLRADTRILVETNSYAGGFLNQLVNFIIGNGMEVDFALKGPQPGAVSGGGIVDQDGDGVQDTAPAVKKAEQIKKEFCDKNDWGCGVEDREVESCLRGERDAEVFLRFFADDDGIPRVRFTEPEQIEPPPGDPDPVTKTVGYDTGNRWSWGIECEPDDAETRLRYYVRPLDQVQAGFEGKAIDAGEFVHFKKGTDRTVKRGVSPFAVVAKAFRQCEKINNNMAEVTAIQAAIAYIREHAATTLPGQIDDLVSAAANYTTRQKSRGGDKVVNNEIHEPGTRLDVSSGMKFLPGPASASAPAYIQVLQSRLRQICARFGMPEFFTGDACLSEDSQILTRRGWMGPNQIREGDEIGTVNPRTHSLEYQKAKRHWRAHRDGSMVRLKTTHFDLLVTPNHDLYLTRLAPAKPNWRKASAESIVSDTPGTFGCLSTARWVDGQTPDKIELPGLGWHDAELVLQFIGIYLGDGSITAKTSRVAVGGLTKQRKADAFGPILESLGFKHHHSTESGRHTWYVDNQQLHDWLKTNVGTVCEDKRLPEFVWDLDAAGLELIWSGLLESDGHQPPGKRSCCYCTTSKRLADDVQILALRLGHRAAIAELPPGKFGTLINYKVHVSPGIVQTFRPDNITLEKSYSGIVWCVEVPNGLIVSRRNGKVSVSGNSNANYASTLVAGGPFERAITRSQKQYAGFTRAVFRKVLRMATDADRLTEEEYESLEVLVTPDPATIANKLEETQIRQIENQAGVLSPQTWQQETGRDTKQEAANLQAWKQLNPDAGGDQMPDFAGLFDAGRESYSASADDPLSEISRVGLVKKTVTDKNGNKKTVWVKSGEDAGAHPSKHDGVEYGNADDRNADDAATSKKIKKADAKVAAIKAKLDAVKALQGQEKADAIAAFSVQLDAAAAKSAAAKTQLDEINARIADTKARLAALKSKKTDDTKPAEKPTSETPTSETPKASAKAPNTTDKKTQNKAREAAYEAMAAEISKQFTPENKAKTTPEERKKIILGVFNAVFKKMGGILKAKESANAGLFDAGRESFREIGPAPFPGAVFDKTKHRWVKPGESKAAKPKAKAVQKVPEKVLSSQAAAAKKAHVFVGADIQRYAEEHNEPKLAKSLGGISLPDSEPVDVIVPNSDGVAAHGIEMKTSVVSANRMIDMNPYAKVRKINWEKAQKGSTYHTVVFDDHDVYDHSGKGNHDESKRRIFYRRGVGGSKFSIDGMHEVKDVEELKAIMAMPEANLPPKAARTDADLRVGVWKPFQDEQGKGFANSKTGRIVRSKK